MNKHGSSNIGAARLCAGLLAIAALISGCGSGGGGGGSSSGGGTDPVLDSFSIGGVITGNDAAVTLSLNGTEQTFTGPNFTFDNEVVGLSVYSVAFISTPANQSCVVGNNTGIAIMDITNVTISCTAPSSIMRFNDASINGRLNAGDFNGDGLADLAFSINTLASHPTGANNRMTRFSFGNGAGLFPQSTDIDTVNDNSDPNKQGRDSVSVDLNNDGRSDFTQSTGQLLESYMGDVTNIPLNIFNSGEYAGAPLVSFDADGNGFNDFIGQIYGGSINNFFSLYRNNGNGTWGAREQFAPASQALNLTISNFTHGDFNGDGNTDLLAIGHVGGASLALGFYAGDGAGNFANPTSLTALSNDLFLGESIFDITYKEITTGDFNGDGNIDIAITSTTSFIQVMIGDGAGGFSAGQRVVIGSQPIHVRAADFDNDGQLDLASLNDGSKTLHLSYGAGDGTFGETGGAPDSWESIQLDGNASFYDMDLADFDLDGFLDIALVNEADDEGTARGAIILVLSPGE